jgi:CubicO group peptidase (beta-lactamase class C family)
MYLKTKITTAIFTSLIFCFLLLQPVSGQDKARELDALLTELYENRDLNGVVLAAQKGKVIFKKAYGYANFETQTLLTTSTPFNLAAVSKQFTAMGIMILAERGKLKYDDSIVNYLPELDYKDITIRHLLNHTSGLVEYVKLFETYEWGTSKIADNNDVIEFFEKYKPKPRFKAGSAYRYSNTGYVLLACIIERVSGQSFEVFLKQNIFDPLGMRHSFAYNLKMKKCPQQRAMGYAIARTRIEHYDLIFLDGIMGDGNVYCSADDLFKWDQALYTEKLVKKSTLALAFTPGRLNDGRFTHYGFGWIISTDRKIMKHPGAWRGFSAMIHRNIAAKSTLIFLDNSTNSYRSRIIRTLLNCLEGEEYTLPKKSIAAALLKTIREKDIDAAVRLYYELKRTQPQAYNFNENSINILGYQLLGEKKIDEAIRIFLLNVEAFPSSFNVYDSLGEAYMIKGNKELAIKNYRKSLELDPTNVNAKEKLEKLTE